MSELKIEKGVPLPKDRRYASFPFEKMEIGDSIFVEKNSANVRSAASYYGKRNGKTFSCLTENGGIRVWRIS